MMHKTFYASGFLYHLPTQQILLQQSALATSLSFPWVLFEQEYEEKDQPDTTFKDMILQLLDVKVTSTYPIYTYTDEVTEKNRSLMYATVKKPEKFSPKGDCVFQWFSFKEIVKLKATDQVKHDIIVGQRVIEAAERKRLGLHTF